MKNTENIKMVLNKAHSTEGMSLGDWYEEYEFLEKIALTLVENKIKGNRKGLDNEPNYKHSIRVFQKVKGLHHWDDPSFEMFLAALLHDIVEDGGVTFEELVEMGFSRNTIELVYLCTHNASIENRRERWLDMVAKLVRANNEEAWCIKLIDLADNISQSHGLTPSNRKFMLEVKAPMMLRLTDHLVAHDFRYREYLKSALKRAKGGV